MAFEGRSQGVKGPVTSREIQEGSPGELIRGEGGLQKPPSQAKARRVLGDLCSLAGHGQAWAAVVWEPWPGSRMPGVGNGSLQEGYQLLERTIN